jgi:hypothetical protein
MRRAQTSLEGAVGFLVTLSLLLGTIAMWAWTDKHIAKRQPAFNGAGSGGDGKGRVDAGKPTRDPESHEGGDKPQMWEKNDENEVYQAEDLKKDEVNFRAL